MSGDHRRAPGEALITRASLAPRFHPQQPNLAPTLLDPRGARVILGAAQSNTLAEPITPSAISLFGPRGVCLCAPHGPLIVSDTGHHRLLVWSTAPTCDNAPADLVIGQHGFTGEGRNACGEPGAATLNMPTGIAFGADVLAVADAWNHRVLLWHGVPRYSNQPADIVLGQADFVSSYANRGLPTPRADTLHWCYGVTISDGRLFVADTGNRRVLVWDRIPTRNGERADLVLGQRDFETRDEGSGGDTRIGMRWPHAIVAGGTACFVSDAGSSRIMAWQPMPIHNGAPCDFLLGQDDFARSDHNRGAYDPTAATLNMPYGVTQYAERLIVADTANSRIIAFESHNLGMGAHASSLAGQRSFDEKGDNRWQFPARDSLCWPYDVAASGDVLAIADSGNSRVLLWNAA